MTQRAAVSFTGEPMNGLSLMFPQAPGGAIRPLGFRARVAARSRAYRRADEDIFIGSAVLHGFQMNSMAPSALASLRKVTMPPSPIEKS